MRIYLFFRTSRSESLCKIHIQTDSLLRPIHFPVQYATAKIGKNQNILTRVKKA